MSEQEKPNNVKRTLDGTVKYVPVFASFYNVIRKMDDMERLAVYDAICEYGFFFHQPDFDISQLDFPSETTEDIFSLMRPNIEVTVKKMIGGKKGGRPRNQG